ncbi:Rok-like winged helix domain-containing protein [Bacillus swezeyi]|uniref:Transcriptional repressor Rok n=1 Tax=Bacillus swezeyi TaxID=1925020 RepID=A0A5M8RHN8_9BACI|nr:transcriptional repressor Rok [Bacillus swezeyi]KAA6446958.1 transcriptional repressor Rok [Bacillus swezeyi]KAA6471526.1 transcriptional repressor Rok [Bacillus swezeyi]
MFSEREALRLRLEQLKDAEIKMIRELQIERNQIYSKLRQLDSPDYEGKNRKKSLYDVVKSLSEDLKNKPFGKTQSNSPVLTNSESALDRRKRIVPGSKASIQREAALKILSENQKGVKSIELQKKIENDTGTSISNMTTFMQNLMKLYPEVKKPYRGLYKLDKESLPQEQPLST